MILNSFHPRIFDSRSRPPADRSEIDFRMDARKSSYS